jgi:transcriptional regulator with XRE-family HTH domain
VRYCRCGARLARDNPQERGGPCGQKAREVALGPPRVPAEFWEAEQMRAALESRHMGRVCYAYRHHRFHEPGPLSQEVVAGWFGIAQAQLSRIENGPPMRDLDKLIYWARTLQIPASCLWFDLPDERRNAPQPEGQREALLPDGPLLVAEWTPERTVSLLESIGGEGGGVEITPSLAVRLAHEWLVTEPPQIIEIRAGRRIGEGLIRKVECRVEHLRHMDDFIGGKDLYQLVEKELQATVSLLNEAAYTEALGKRLLAAVGDLCGLAGWVAADADLDAAAQRYYVGGIHAAHAADDAALAGNLISMLSYLFANVGNPREAVLLAHTALAGARYSVSATTKALFQERIAWAHARAYELSQTKRALGEADRAYEQCNPADDPSWVYWLDRDEMDVMAGRCYTELCQPRRAEPLLRSVLDHYDENQVRETLLYCSWLAECYVQTDDIDEAAGQACRALVLSTRVNSSRAQERVTLIRQRLRPYRDVAAVGAFEELYRELSEE